MKKLKFFRCEHCGNVVIKLVDKEVPLFCCGDKMHELVANTTDAAQEKHVPVVKAGKNVFEVKVGATLHPMTAEHYISFIAVETETGTFIKHLSPNDLPQASFAVNEKVVAVYAYCNLHGLWMASL